MRDKVAACVKRYDVSLENIVKQAALWTGISEDIIYLLKNVEVFESSRKTDNLRRKLIKKGLLEPITDDLGRSKRRIYRVSPQLKAMLNSFKPKGVNRFYPDTLIGRGCCESRTTPSRVHTHRSQACSSRLGQGMFPYIHISKDTRPYHPSPLLGFVCLAFTVFSILAMKSQNVLPEKTQLIISI